MCRLNTDINAISWIQPPGNSGGDPYKGSPASSRRLLDLPDLTSSDDDDDDAYSSSSDGNDSRVFDSDLSYVEKGVAGDQASFIKVIAFQIGEKGCRFDKNYGFFF